MSDLEFHLKVGDKVQHVKDDSFVGIITHIDENLIPDYGVTTCNVQWCDCEYPPDDAGDIQWTNKLVVVK